MRIITYLLIVIFASYFQLNLFLAICTMLILLEIQTAHSETLLNIEGSGKE